MMDASDRNKQIVRDYIENVVNTGDVSQIDRYISVDYVEVYRNKEFPIGIEGAKQHVLGVRRTYPDLRISIERQIAEGDWVATLITARGTHKGEWLGIHPTGKIVEYSGVNINRLRDDLIVEHGGAANLLETLLEIGAVKLVTEKKD